MTGGKCILCMGFKALAYQFYEEIRSRKANIQEKTTCATQLTMGKCTKLRPSKQNKIKRYICCDHVANYSNYRAEKNSRQIVKKKTWLIYPIFTCVIYYLCRKSIEFQGRGNSRQNSGSIADENVKIFSTVRRET